MGDRITIRMTAQELSRLDDFAREHELTRSEVIRRAIAARIQGVTE